LKIHQLCQKTFASKHRAVGASGQNENDIHIYIEDIHFHPAHFSI